MPNVSGSLGGLETGNMAQDYVRLSFAVKGDLGDKLAYMVTVNEPYGADAFYTAGAYTGLEAHWESTQVAALLKYQFSDRVSASGGLRYVTSSADIFIPTQMLDPLGPIQPRPRVTASSAISSARPTRFPTSCCGSA